VPRLFRRHSNLYGDLSAGSGFNALARDPAQAARFLNEFQDRLLFGTDICYATQKLPLAGFLIKLRDAGDLSETVFQKIARGNAVRLFEL
jgi:predicted TIM-barrel fold metal-dependent hydrolase